MPLTDLDVVEHAGNALKQKVIQGADPVTLTISIAGSITLGRAIAEFVEAAADADNVRELKGLSGRAIFDRITGMRIAPVAEIAIGSMRADGSAGTDKTVAGGSEYVNPTAAMWKLFVTGTSDIVIELFLN